MGIYEDDTRKALRFFSGNTEITNKVKVNSFSVQNIMNDKQLTFGSCNSARAQMTTIEDLNLTGETIRVEFGAGEEWQTIGTYKVTYSSKQTNNNDITCTMYDSIKEYDVNVADWYSGLTFPMTLKAFRTSLADYIGVAQESITLVNDTMTVYETIAPSRLKGTDVLACIGELNGVFAHADENNVIRWVSLGNTPKIIDSSVIQGTDGVSMKDYETSPIGKLVIRSEDGDVGITVGSGANTYYVTGNFLVYGLTNDQLSPIATNLFNKIAGIRYTPTTMKMKSNPTLKMGDLLSYNGKLFYLLKKKTSGLLFDEITCDGNEYLEEDDSVETNIEQLRGKSNVITQTVEQNSAKITNIESDYTTHTEFMQTSERIAIEIESLQSQIDGSVELIITNENPTLLNYPYWDWTGMYADDTYKASDDLHFLYPQAELQRHLRTMVFNEDSSQTFRFVKIAGQYTWQEVADTETSVILNRLTTLEATTEGITGEVSQISYDLEHDYWTIADTKTAIKQASDSILLSVSGDYATKTETNSLAAQLELKVNSQDLISTINASADVINLKAGRLVISSGNFTLDASGKITAKSGTIGGWTIATNGGNYFLRADNGDYRAYMQPPINSSTWVYSVQHKNGTSYIGDWYITGAGEEHVQKIICKGAISMDGNLTVGGYATITGNAQCAGLVATDGIVCDQTIKGNTLESLGIAYADNGKGKMPCIVGNQALCLMFDNYGINVMNGSTLIGRLRYS